VAVLSTALGSGFEQVALVFVGIAGAGMLVLPTLVQRSLAMAVGLLLAVGMLVAEVTGDAGSITGGIPSSPALLISALVIGPVVLGALAYLFIKRPQALLIAAVAAFPFRVPIGIGGETSNLLIPLYTVIGAGVVAYLVKALKSREIESQEGAAGREPQLLERALALGLILYVLQAAYSADFSEAVKQCVFFYIPFAALYALLREVQWTKKLALTALVVLGSLAVVFVGVGFVEYSSKQLLLNPDALDANQYAAYFRVSSLFFDPNIYGRFLVTVMIAFAGVLLWSKKPKYAWGAAVVLALLLAGLLLTLSQSSFAALLAGLTVLAALRWSVKLTLTAGTVAVLVAVALIVVSPSTLGVKTGKSESLNKTTSGRIDLINGGIDLFTSRPFQGYGSGAFAYQYRAQERTSNLRAATASHTTPITVAAEQGLVGLLAYLLIVGAALSRLFKGFQGDPTVAVLAAGFTALLVHTLSYAAFLEDPSAWVLLAVATAVIASRPSVPASLRYKQRVASRQKA